MKSAIREFLLSVLVGEFHLPIDPKNVRDETQLGPNGFNLESLGFVDLAFRIEDRFGFSIPEDDYVKLAGFTTGELVGYIESKAAPEASTP